MLDVLEKDGLFYWCSLVDGSVNFILNDDIEYKVNYTDAKGYKCEPNIVKDKTGYILSANVMVLKPQHIIALSELKKDL